MLLYSGHGDSDTNIQILSQEGNWRALDFSGEEGQGEAYLFRFFRGELTKFSLGIKDNCFFWFEYRVNCVDSMKTAWV